MRPGAAWEGVLETRLSRGRVGSVRAGVHGPGLGGAGGAAARVVSLRPVTGCPSPCDRAPIDLVIGRPSTSGRPSTLQSGLSSGLAQTIRRGVSLRPLCALVPGSGCVAGKPCGTAGQPCGTARMLHAIRAAAGTYAFRAGQSKDTDTRSHNFGLNGFSAFPARQHCPRGFGSVRSDCWCVPSP